MEFLNKALSDSQSRLTQFLKAVAVGVMNAANQRYLLPIYMSHELRTPLNAILVVFTQVMSRDYSFSTEAMSTMVTELCRSAGYAYASWESSQPHLSFIDMQMPVINRHEAIKVIKTRKIKHMELTRTNVE